MYLKENLFLSLIFEMETCLLFCHNIALNVVGLVYNRLTSSSSQALGLKVCTTIPGSCLFLKLEMNSNLT